MCDVEPEPKQLQGCKLHHIMSLTSDSQAVCFVWGCAYSHVQISICTSATLHRVLENAASKGRILPLCITTAVSELEKPPRTERRCSCPAAETDVKADKSWSRCLWHHHSRWRMWMWGDDRVVQICAYTVCLQYRTIMGNKYQLINHMMFGCGTATNAKCLWLFMACCFAQGATVID